MLSRLQLAELVHDFEYHERRAIETMHPRDLDTLAEVKERLFREALEIVNDHKRLFDHPLGFFRESPN